MTDAAALLKKTKAGFGNLTVSEKYTNSALNWLEVWLTDRIFEDYVLAYDRRIMPFYISQLKVRADRCQAGG